MHVLLLALARQERYELGHYRTMLVAHGMTFDEHIFHPDVLGYRNGTGANRLRFFEEDGVTPRYAFIMQVASLAYIHPEQPGQWVASPLYPEEQEEQERFERATQARRIVTSSWPTEFDGFARHNVTGPLRATVVLADAAKEVAEQAGFRPDLAMCTNGELWVVMTDIVDTHRIKPFLLYDDTRPDCAGPLFGASGAAAAIVQRSTREELHIFLAVSDVAGSPSRAIVGGLALMWASRGLYVGSRRLLLSAQVDDYFLPTGAWQPDLLQGQGPPQRISPDDMDFHVAFQKQMAAEVLPPGSSFVMEMAFNGYGVPQHGGPAEDPLFIHSQVVLRDFYWLTHTYSHLSLTLIDQMVEICLPQYGGTRYLQPTPYDAAWCELTVNQYWGDQLTMSDCGTNTTRDVFATVEEDVCAVFSSKAIVTPRISGLFNNDSIAAMLNAGLTNCVGDNSCVAQQDIAAGEGTCSGNLRPSNKYHGIVTTKEEHGHPGLFIIPRYATDIYYNVGTEEQEVSQFRFVYAWHPQKSQYDLHQIMMFEAQRTSAQVLMLLHDPYMFHQANMIVFPVAPSEGPEQPGTWEHAMRAVIQSRGNHSLLSYWSEAAIRAIGRYSTLPVLTLRQDVLAVAYVERMQRDKCDFTVFAHFGEQELGQRGPDPNATLAITVLGSSSANVSCIAGVTGFRALHQKAGTRIVPPAADTLPPNTRVDDALPPRRHRAGAYWVEEYGTDTTTWLHVRPNASVTLLADALAPLAEPVLELLVRPNATLQLDHAWQRWTDATTAPSRNASLPGMRAPFGKLVGTLPLGFRQYLVDPAASVEAEVQFSVSDTPALTHSERACLWASATGHPQSLYDESTVQGSVHCALGHAYTNGVPSYWLDVHPPMAREVAARVRAADIEVNVTFTWSDALLLECRERRAARALQRARQPTYLLRPLSRAQRCHRLLTTPFRTRRARSQAAHLSLWCRRTLSAILTNPPPLSS